MNIQDKIEKILLKNNDWYVEFSKKSLDKVVKELLTLIQESNKEAFNDGFILGVNKISDEFNKMLDNKLEDFKSNREIQHQEFVDNQLVEGVKSNDKVGTPDIDKIRKEAVGGFVKFIEKRDTGCLGVSFRTNYTVNGIKAEAEEYLSSIGKDKE